MSRFLTPSRRTSRRASISCRHRPAASPTRRRSTRPSEAVGGTGRSWPRAIMGASPAHRGAHAAILAALAAALLAGSGCTSRNGGPHVETANNVVLTAAQRQHVQLYTVAQSQFRHTLETTAAI